MLVSVREVGFLRGRVTVTVFGLVWLLCLMAYQPL